MLVLRDNYYSSPLIIDEDEYLERLFTISPARLKELRRPFKMSGDFRALKDSMLGEIKGPTKREMIEAASLRRKGPTRREMIEASLRRVEAIDGATSRSVSVARKRQ